jgi:OOP family OmpA-OmpF porin
MNTLRRKALPAAISLALGVATPAHAAAGWYAGLGAGVSSADELSSLSGGDLELALIDSGIAASIGSFSADDSDTGWRVFGGYGFNDYFAVEGFYTDLGSFDSTFSGTVEDGGEGGPLALDGSVSFEAQGFGIFGVLMYPLGAGFSVLGKAGGIHWDADVPIAVVVDGSGASGSVGDDGTDFAWGGGLKYQITEQLAVDVQYESFDVFDTDVELISGNLSWGF